MFFLPMFAWEPYRGARAAEVMHLRIEEYEHVPTPVDSLWAVRVRANIESINHLLPSKAKMACSRLKQDSTIRHRKRLFRFIKTIRASAWLEFRASIAPVPKERVADALVAAIRA